MEISAIYVIAQCAGVLGMLFNVLSFQCKDNRRLMFALGTGSVLFAVNYMLLGSFASAGFNIVGIFRSVTATNKKTHNNIFFAITGVLFTIVAIATYENLWTVILLSAQLAATYAMWYKDGGFIRRMQFFYVSPIWLINNTFIVFTVGGVVCELFIIVSVIVSFIRFGKDGFDRL